nr:hypothetical protein Iba_chr03bCG8710 [Ipomoea batatas]
MAALCRSQCVSSFAHVAGESAADDCGVADGAGGSGGDHAEFESSGRRKSQIVLLGLPARWGRETVEEISRKLVKTFRTRYTSGSNVNKQIRYKALKKIRLLAAYVHAPTANFAPFSNASGSIAFSVSRIPRDSLLLFCNQSKLRKKKPIEKSSHCPNKTRS